MSLHINLEHVFRPIGVLNRSTQLRRSKVKYKSGIYFKASSSASPLLLLKLPFVVSEGDEASVRISEVSVIAAGPQGEN